jgi:nicotinamidase/pyrazinamidase
MNVLYWDIDTLHDFMRPDGKLYVPGAEKIEPQLALVRRYADLFDSRIVSMNDWHDADAEEFKQYPPHCIAMTPGAHQVPATLLQNAYTINHRWKTFDQEQARDSRLIRLYKDSTDSFSRKGAPHTDNVLRIIKPDVNVVSGVVTEICVDQAVTGLLDRGQNVYVVTDAIKELPGTDVEAVYRSWRERGAHTVTTAELEPLIMQWSWDERVKRGTI